MKYDRVIDGKHNRGYCFVSNISAVHQTGSGGKQPAAECHMHVLRYRFEYMLFRVYLIDCQIDLGQHGHRFNHANDRT